MPEKLLNNLYRLPVPLEGNPLKELNAYLIKGTDRSLLIDTGFRCATCREALFSQLSELGVRPGCVDVLLTHLHSDHSGLAADVAGEAGQVYISGLDSAVLGSEEQNRARMDRTKLRFIAEGFPASALERLQSTNPAYSMAPPCDVPHHCLEDGDVLEAGGYRLRCLSMPGHTPGQMCFWIEREGIMFLGDHVLFDITPNITFWRDLPDALGVYQQSLKKMRQYDVRLALPGHRGRGDLNARIDQLLLHHERRLEEALRAVRAHPGQSAYQLAGYMTWKIRSNSWEDFPLTQKWFAVGECVSHLERLEAEGLIRRELTDGAAAYYAV